MVECNLAKVDVAGSNPVSRSIKRRHTQVAKGEVCKTFMLRFESGCRLQCIKSPIVLLGFLLPIISSTRILKELLHRLRHHFRQCIDYPNIIESLKGT